MRDRAVVDDRVDLLEVKPGVELRARAPLHTVNRPAPSLLHKRAVVRRMPIACRDHEVRFASEPVDRLYHRVAVGNSQRPVSTEIVLDVDDDQRSHWREYSPGIARATKV